MVSAFHYRPTWWRWVSRLLEMLLKRVMVAMQTSDRAIVNFLYMIKIYLVLVLICRYNIVSLIRTMVPPAPSTAKYQIVLWILLLGLLLFSMRANKTVDPRLFVCAVEPWVDSVQDPYDSIPVCKSKQWDITGPYNNSCRQSLYYSRIYRRG